MTYKIMLPNNDNSCGWINELPKRTGIKELLGRANCDWLIIGAGYTGLSAARQLGNIYPNKKIIIVDAQVAGEGASSRNSGYLVDSTMNDGFISSKSTKDYKAKSDLYSLGIEKVKKFIAQYQVDCDWNECGKYYASSKIEDEKKLIKFNAMLNSLKIENKILQKDEMLNKLGTEFYKIGIYTNGGILLNPGKLARAMVDSLPENVILYENSPLLNWEEANKRIKCTFNKGVLEASSIIFCANGFLSSLGIEKQYSFPLALTASMTRSLTETEFETIGSPREWGVLSTRPMGATVRMTKDRRILIRNTVSLCNKGVNIDINKCIHLKGILKRFPSLPKDIIDSTWSGIVCRSGNAAPIFKKISDNIYATGCFNGSGIGLGTLFGEEIANKASNNITNEVELIQKAKKPNWLPPQPFLNLGIKARFLIDKNYAKSEL
tara:strand:+ start:3599 stop:4906 length:1308 start_codon:yes stop_codon:yes gene_type:complete